MNLDEAIKKHIELNGFNNAMIEQIGHVVEICKKHSIEKEEIIEAIKKCTMKDGVYGDTGDTLYPDYLSEELRLK